MTKKVSISKEAWELVRERIDDLCTVSVYGALVKNDKSYYLSMSSVYGSARQPSRPILERQEQQPLTEDGARIGKPLYKYYVYDPKEVVAPS